MRPLTTLLTLLLPLTTVAPAQSLEPEIRRDSERPEETREPARTTPERDELPSATGSDPILPATLEGVGPAIPLDRMHYDRPGDGNLWAMGAAYKARFGAEGARFVPYFGAEAPVNRPVDFVLESVTVGGRPLAFESNVPAQRDGDLVRYERGTLTELYAMSPDSMEQRFRFDYPVGPLGGAGLDEELVVRIGVSTDLAPNASSEVGEAGAFEWTSPLGSVRYGKATVIDASGSSSAAPSQLAGGVIEIRVPAAFLASARYPLTIDPIVSVFDVDISNHSDFFPDIAYDRQTGRWAYVWSRLFSGSDWDVWCETRSVVGSFIEGAYIDMTSASWVNARVAANQYALQYLVVAEFGPSGRRVIGGRTRQATSVSMSSQFLVSDNLPDEKINPDVGGDPHNGPSASYLVVFERIDGPTDHDIHGQLVDTNGSRFGARIHISNTTFDDRAPAVSNSNGKQVWTVAFEREINPTNHDIRAARVAYNGNVTEFGFNVDASSGVSLKFVSPFCLIRRLARRRVPGVASVLLTGCGNAGSVRRRQNGVTNF